ncbi:MAG TPA: ABC transporter permease, partial [Vicinamibacterales bacterium]|nr:ABC transporter permease [Vicinamibacterales bacterium]
MDQQPAAVRFYRRLLRLFPAGFRERFEPDLLDLFRDKHRAAAARGRLSLAAFWIRVVLDAAISAPAERFARRPARAAGGVLPMQGLLQDVRYALRVTARRPAMSLVIVATLALGIGANTAIFSVVNTVLLRPLPYRDASRLVMVWEQMLERGDDDMPVRPANFFDWKARARSFEDVAWSRDAMYNVTGDGEPESVIGYRFSANMFEVLGVQPALGRVFRADEDRPGAPKVAVLSHKLWQRRYAGDTAVLGRAITLNGESYTVVGVMPPAFNHPQGTELWTPIALTPAIAARRDVTLLRLVGRLKPGGTREQAEAELAALYQDLARQHPETNTGMTQRVTELGDPGDAKPLLAILFAGVGFVLLIACANVANLLLADAASRRRELAVRSALGASRARVARQVLTESVLLALAGGTVGMLMTWLTGDRLAALFPANISNLNLPLVERIDVGAGVFLFALLISSATGLLFGLLPAWNVARADLQGALKEDNRGGSSSRRTHGALVVTEVALSIVLLAGALLMVQSFVRLQQQRLGFDADRVLSARLLLPQYRYGDGERVAAFTRALVERLQAMPGVESVGVTNFLPLSGWWGTRSFFVEGRPDPAPGAEPTADNRLATEDYFRSMGIRLLAGRTFTARDDGSAPRVVIINETLAKRYWPGEDPIGRRILTGGGEDRVAHEIIGIVGDVKSFGLEEPTHAELFFPYWQMPWPLLGVAVRAHVDPASLSAGLRQAVWSIDRDQPITHLLPMEDLASESLAFRRVGMMLGAGFGLLALVLAALGIYGVLSCSVARRTREIGVRVALGATRTEVAALVVRQGLLMTVIGLAIGLAGALALTRWLASVLFEVRPGDPATFAAAAVILLIVALLAAWLPARRATAVDPIVAL